jgi:hypothetical protein
MCKYYQCGDVLGIKVNWKTTPDTVMMLKSKKHTLSDEPADAKLAEEAVREVPRSNCCENV